MDNLSNEELDNLLALADTATPGKRLLTTVNMNPRGITWYQQIIRVTDNDFLGGLPVPKILMQVNFVGGDTSTREAADGDIMCHEPGPRTKADAAFIAAANPDTVRRMALELQALRALSAAPSAPTVSAEPVEGANKTGLRFTLGLSKQDLFDAADLIEAGQGKAKEASILRSLIDEVERVGDLEYKAQQDYCRVRKLLDVARAKGSAPTLGEGASPAQQWVICDGVANYQAECQWAHVLMPNNEVELATWQEHWNEDTKTGEFAWLQHDEGHYTKLEPQPTHFHPVPGAPSTTQKGNSHE